MASYIDLPVRGFINQYRRRRVDSNHQINDQDNYIGCDANGGAVTLELPPAASFSEGRCIVVKDEGGSCSNVLKRVFIAPHGTNKVDGSNSAFSLQADYESVTLVCNGVDEWFII
jgi:hypothetical protein